MNTNKYKGSFLSQYKIVKPFLDNQKPLTLEVHTEFRCNYNCEWCIDKTLKQICLNKDSESSLSERGVVSIIDSCIELGVKGIILSGGGEPTLNKNTELLVRLADEAGIIIGLFTNGSLLTKETIKEYIKHLSFIRFSFDDFSPKNYSLTKGVPERNYYLVLDNIKKCVGEKKYTNNTKCRIGIDFILTPNNIERMEQIYREVRNLGVDYLQFCDCVIIGYEFTKQRKKDIRQGLKKVIARKKADGIPMDVVYEPIQMENKVPCSECHVKEYIVQVGADGGVRPCPHLARHDELLYGNIYDKPLHELWKDRPDKLDTDLLYENCRFRRQNEILFGLKNITHGEMI
jgi:MoaA/NifB/PqqE/SkfB family radical SAM enzyme